MSYRTLTLRKTQIALLSRACERSERARITARRSDAPAPTGRTRLLALEHDGVLVEWPEPNGGVAEVGRPVELWFDHDGERYAFWAETIAGGEPGRTLKLTLPLRLERKSYRSHFRTSLHGMGPVLSRLTSVNDQTFSFDMRLTNISSGGLAGTTLGPLERSVQVSDLFWAEFQIPEANERFEFVVRLAHLRAVADGRLVIGCAFQPVDDQGSSRSRLEHLRTLVARRRPTTAMPVV